MNTLKFTYESIIEVNEFNYFTLSLIFWVSFIFILSAKFYLISVGVFFVSLLVTYFAYKNRDNIDVLASVKSECELLFEEQYLTCLIDGNIQWRISFNRLSHVGVTECLESNLFGSNFKGAVVFTNDGDSYSLPSIPENTILQEIQSQIQLIKKKQL